MYPQVKSPQIFLCGTFFEQQALKIGMQFGINGQNVAFHICDTFNHVTECVLRQLFEFLTGNRLPKDLHN